MKTINSLIVSAAILGAGSAFAAEDPVRQYLVDNHLVSAPIDSNTAVQSQAAQDVDATTQYLVESGLIEAPNARVEVQGDAPQFAIDGKTRRILSDWGLLAS